MKTMCRGLIGEKAGSPLVEEVASINIIMDIIWDIKEET